MNLLFRDAGAVLTFCRLVESETGKIVLYNLRTTVLEGILPHPLGQEALWLLSKEIARLTVGYDFDELKAAIGSVVWDGLKFLMRGTEQPSDSLRIAAIRTLEDLKPILNRIQKVHSPPEIDSLFDLPTHDALAAAAEVINDYQNIMPHLTIGSGFNAFWATSATETQSVIDSASDPAQALRDRLGLVQYQPSARTDPMIHLFLFEGVAPLNCLPDQESFRCARPTTLDGFDNPRFRQARPTAMAALGCGSTVDLAGGAYTDGAPELISTEMPLKDRFKCSYIGPLYDDPSGTDTDFVTFLSCGVDAVTAATELDALSVAP